MATVRIEALLLVACLGGVAPAPALGAEPSRESLVVFGTSCARCHEAECSGRLSFDQGADAAAVHVRRHAGPVSDASVQELFALLEKMKSECAYPQVQAPLPTAAGWSADLLDRFRNPSGRSYFLPLGALEPGRYALGLGLAGEPHVHLELVTRDFELLLDEPLEIREGRATAVFEAPKPADAFLRLRAQEEIRWERLSLRKAASDP
ncbi:MAG: hypothetical protein QNK03_14050 [Myxococcota bacterium]|nr:hypothetical protein [Myxococcota bacterium]